MKKRTAFTLIELLVVIAIIALLLSIIVPALRLTKEKSKNLSCRANTRSIAMAFRLYTEQYDGRVFTYYAGLYLNQLTDQIGELNKVRYCPSTIVNETIKSTDWGSSTQTWTWSSGVSEPEHGSYGFNGWLYQYPVTYDYSWVETKANLDKYAYKNTQQALNTASVPVFFDGLWVDAWPKHSDTIPVDLDIEIRVEPGMTLSAINRGTDSPVNNHIRRLMLKRHWGTSNVSFLDGHVDSIKLGYLWSFKWHQKFIPFTEEKLRDDDKTKIYID